MAGYANAHFDTYAKYDLSTATKHCTRKLEQRQKHDDFVWEVLKEKTNKKR